MKKLCFALFLLSLLSCNKQENPNKQEDPIKKEDPVVKEDVSQKVETNYVGTTRYIHFYIERGFVKRDTTFSQDTVNVVETLDSIFFKPAIVPNITGFVKNTIQNSYCAKEEFGNGHGCVTLIAPDSLKKSTFVSLKNSMGTDQNDYLFLGKKVF